MAMFKATKTQVLTYLFGICPFSIAFLVFLNSSVSFVITDLIGQHRGEGDAVGTLGFADELVALAACPIWGLLSDRIGVRTVCMLGYFIIALALVLFVQAKNVYPQLLLGRLFFSIGGAAASTMVTAILPAVAASASAISGHQGSIPTEQQNRDHAASISSDTTITPSRSAHQADSSDTGPQSTMDHELSTQSSSRIAGFVGLFTGIGALIALAVFLPLPARFQKAGVSPGKALQDSYYIVAVVALILSALSYIGLSGLMGEEHKGILTAIRSSKNNESLSKAVVAVKPFWRRFGEAFVLGVRHPKVGLGYVGGFVARASSVGISLFIPLAINAQFRQAGLCNLETTDTPAGLPDLKRRCPRAYTLSAELTGVSQLIALLAAPGFGYLMSRFGKRYLPLAFGALAGIIGYVMFGVTVQRRRTKINGNPLDFVAMALIGVSQIAAIVCSLGILSDGVLQLDSSTADRDRIDGTDNGGARAVEESNPDDETTALMGHQHPPRGGATELKGSVAGLYSLYGGAGILILTKVGGALFDSLSFGSPFYIMAIFNGILLVVCVVANILRGPTRNDGQT